MIGARFDQNVHSSPTLFSFAFPDAVRTRISFREDAGANDVKTRPPFRAFSILRNRRYHGCSRIEEEADWAAVWETSPPRVQIYTPTV
jgi:hypothetical protein